MVVGPKAPEGQIRASLLASICENENGVTPRAGAGRAGAQEWPHNTGQEGFSILILSRYRQQEKLSKVGR